jgi:hypothetical protein
MSYQFTPTAEPVRRCGYRIQPVEDIPRMVKGVHIKGPDWYAVLSPEEWQPYADIDDDNEFAAKVLGLALELQLDIRVEVTRWPGSDSTAETTSDT